MLKFLTFEIVVRVKYVYFNMKHSITIAVIPTFFYNIVSLISSTVFGPQC